MSENIVHTPNYERERSLVLKSIFFSVVTTVAVLWLIAIYAPQFLPQPNIGQSAQSGSSTLIETDRLVTTQAIPDVVEKATPAVVSVVISADVPIIERYFEEYNPFDFFGGGFGFQIPRQREIGTERREIGGGTGFFVSQDGYLITNSHVVSNTDANFSIVTHDGTSYDVEIVADDPTLDIAILKVQSDQTFPYLEFSKEHTVRLGSVVIAIGNALAEFPNTVSVGVVSGLSRNIIAGNTFGYTESLEGVIQTDAAINQGNSGGPLLDETGKVIGVNVAMAGNSENIGFALPADPIRSAYESVREHGEILRPFLGVRYVQITEQLANTENLPVEYGVRIARGETADEPAIVPNSPADKAGLKENDIILEIDGQKLDKITSLGALIRNHAIGDTITLKILRDREESEITATLERTPSTVPE